MIRVNKILNNSLFCECIQELKSAEKERIFCKHGIEHLLSVARIMKITALENSTNLNSEMIYSTALLHDIGRGRAYRLGTDHAEESAVIARQILKECGFENSETDIIISAILHHNYNDTANELCYLLRKADKLSRNCFMCSAYEQCNWNEDKKNRGIIV